MSETEIERVADLLDPNVGDPNEIVASSSNDSVSRQDFLKFRYDASLKVTDKWINDAAINYHSMFLTREFENSAFFSSFFISKLLDRIKTGTPKEAGTYKYHFENVKRWKRNVDIFDKEYIFIPIHQDDCHWVVVVVNFREKEIIFYDPKHPKVQQEFVDHVFHYLKDAHMHRRKQPLPYQDLWTMQHNPRGPWQYNNHDCGIFAMLLMDNLAKGVAPEFVVEKDMEQWRWFFVNRILKFSDQLESEKRKSSRTRKKVQK